jgi:oxygen-independent coproporphyrinogen-3 oxidase
MAGLYENIELIDREGAMSEYMILGLRLTEGVSSKEFEERFGEKPEDIYGDELKKLTARGLLTAEPGGKCRCDSDTRYKLTRLGFDLANAVFVEFI